MKKETKEKVGKKVTSGIAFILVRLMKILIPSKPGQI